MLETTNFFIILYDKKKYPRYSTVIDKSLHSIFRYGIKNGEPHLISACMKKSHYTRSQATIALNYAKKHFGAL